MGVISHIRLSKPFLILQLNNVDIHLIPKDSLRIAEDQHGHRPIRSERWCDLRISSLANNQIDFITIYTVLSNQRYRRHEQYNTKHLVMMTNFNVKPTVIGGTYSSLPTTVIRIVFPQLSTDQIRNIYTPCSKALQSVEKSLTGVAGNKRLNLGYSCTEISQASNYFKTLPQKCKLSARPLDH